MNPMDNKVMCSMHNNGESEAEYVCRRQHYKVHQLLDFPCKLPNAQQCSAAMICGLHGPCLAKLSS